MALGQVDSELGVAPSAPSAGSHEVTGQHTEHSIGLHEDQQGNAGAMNNNSLSYSNILTGLLNSQENGPTQGQELYSDNNSANGPTQGPSHYIRPIQGQEQYSHNNSANGPTQGPSHYIRPTQGQVQSSDKVNKAQPSHYIRPTEPVSDNNNNLTVRQQTILNNNLSTHQKTILRNETREKNKATRYNYNFNVASVSKKDNNVNKPLQGSSHYQCNTNTSNNNSNLTAYELTIQKNTIKEQNKIRRYDYNKYDHNPEQIDNNWHTLNNKKVVEHQYTDDISTRMPIDRQPTQSSSTLGTFDSDNTDRIFEVNFNFLPRILCRII
jgi:hypothetical protein